MLKNVLNSIWKLQQKWNFVNRKHIHTLKYTYHHLWSKGDNPLLPRSLSLMPWWHYINSFESKQKTLDLQHDLVPMFAIIRLVETFFVIKNLLHKYAPSDWSWSCFLLWNLKYQITNTCYVVCMGLCKYDLLATVMLFVTLCLLPHYVTTQRQKMRIRLCYKSELSWCFRY